MNYLEWKQFIKDIVKQGPKITNLKEECRKNHVGLNTLYRKLSILEETDYELYKQFISLHPYVPRDIQGVDFEQLMRESILTGISQKDLEIKYGVDKRTIQRKFANIKKDNSRLHEIYKRYTKLKKGESLHHSIIDEVASEYIPQRVETNEEKLEIRRKKFIESMNNAKEGKNRQLHKHFEEQIRRIDQQQRNTVNNEPTEKEGSER